MTLPLIWGPYDAPCKTWLPEVIRIMKEGGRCGLAIVTPPKSGFDEALAGFAESPEGYALLSEFVGITLTPAAADESLRPPRSRKNRIVLDPFGTPVASDTVKPADLANAAKFVASVRALVPAGRPYWLRAALDRMKRTKRRGIVVVAPDIDAERLGRALLQRYEDPATRDIFSRAVFIGATTAIARAEWKSNDTLFALKPDGALSSSATLGPNVFEDAAVFLATFAPLVDAKGDEPRLPYGCVLPEHPIASVFGTAYDPCPACGMAQVPDESWRFLNFLER